MHFCFFTARAPGVPPSRGAPGALAVFGAGVAVFCIRRNMSPLQRTRGGDIYRYAQDHGDACNILVFYSGRSGKVPDAGRNGLVKEVPHRLRGKLPLIVDTGNLFNKSLLGWRGCGPRDVGLFAHGEKDSVPQSVFFYAQGMKKQMALTDD